MINKSVISNLWYIFSAITIPAAWVETCLFKPSIAKERSINFDTSSFSCFDFNNSSWVSRAFDNVTGLAGVDAGGDVFIASGQEKQTKVQEWIQWKQWALSHKDFEAYKEEKIDNINAFNKSVEDKLRDPEFQKELEPLIKGFKDDLRTLFVY